MSEFVVDIGRGNTVRLPTAGKYCSKDILIVGNPYDKREITEGVLTTDEKDVFATSLPGSYFTISLFVETMYSLVGIDVEPIFKKLGFFDTLRKLFDVDTGALLPEEEQDDTYAKMFVPHFYGGKRSGRGVQLDQNSLKIGDIFIAAQEAPCAVNNVRWVYFCGIYQGGGKFLMAENHSNAACIDCNRIYVDDKYTTKDTAAWGTATEMRNKYRYYFVLRPENLATT